ADAIAATVGHSLLFFLAFWFGDQFLELVQRAESTVDHWIRPLLVLGAVALVGAYLLYHFYERPVSIGDPHELPLIGDKVAAQIGGRGRAPAIREDASGASGAEGPPAAGEPAATPPPADPARPGPTE